MTIMLNSIFPTQAATAGAPAADAAPLPAALPAGVAQPAMPALAAFAQWLGLGQQAEAPLAAADATEGEPASDNAQTAADMSIAPAIPDGALLAAMAQPMTAPGASQPVPADAGATPLSAAELRAGLQAAVPPSAARTGGSEAKPVQAPAAQAMPAQLVASESASAQAAPAGNAGAGAAVGDDSLGQTLSAVFRPLPAAVRAAVAVDPGAAAAAASTDAPVGTESDSGATGERPASANTGLHIGAAAPATVRPAADSVALAGPPAAWRQTLHEALGERLNLQLTKGVEQAVIRLEPPMLGRIEIAIRHSGGTLEVALTATHSEVLRQLHAVSDNLRGDLAQRQFTDVAVTVAQAARGGAAPSGDQQGRGRQPERDAQSQDPGRALAEAGDPSSTFSLSPRA